MSYSHSFPLSSSASLISLSRRGFSIDILSCICLASPTPSLRKLHSGYGLAMHFIIVSYAHVLPVHPTDDVYQLVQVAFSFSVILFWGDLNQSSGYDSGHWFWGTMLYLAVLLTVLGKAALVSECVHVHHAAATIAHAPHIAVYGRSILLQVTLNTPEYRNLNAHEPYVISDPRIICLHHDLPPPLHRNCSQFRFLSGIPGIRSPVIHR
jgi:hypothetical protein